MNFAMRCGSALALMLLAVPVFAQDYRIAHMSPQQLVVLDMNSRTPDQSSKTIYAALAIYHQTAQTGATPIPVDYTVAAGEYDCAQEGRWRLLRAAGFALGKAAPVVDETDMNARWETAPQNTYGRQVWDGVCHGLPESTRTPNKQVTASDRDQMLLKYRTFIKQRANQ